jgi:FMN phosphatase YigB (HAD superfamily)
VGDRLEDEFEGAKAAALKAVLYESDYQEEQRYQSVPQVDSLIKLIAFLN